MLQQRQYEAIAPAVILWQVLGKFLGKWQILWSLVVVLGSEALEKDFERVK